MRTKYTLEAERVLNEFLGRALRDSEINALSDFAEPNEEDIASARKAALDYAHARNTNARTRHYNQENEHAKEGVKSAQDWLRRKQKSTIRKG
jgi:hypothetical protein